MYIDFVILLIPTPLVYVFFSAASLLFVIFIFYVFRSCIYVMRKVRILTIRGFCCVNLGSELLRNNPKDRVCKPRIRTQSSGIAQSNLGHLRQQTHDRSRMQSSFLLRKPRIRTQSSRIAQPNLGHPRKQTHNRSRTQSSSAIRVNEATIDCTRKAVRPSAAKKPRSIVHAKQLGYPLQRTHVAAARMAELFCVRDRLRVCCRGCPRFGCAILDDCVRIRGLRGLRSKICGSEVCTANPRIRGLRARS